ncbi:hypothetical protein SAZ11_00775 [Streptomyces sp. FXJ1.4098]|nr:hypothetical protein [Streptomyces sp. FXJ1.4098]
MEVDRKVMDGAGAETDGSYGAFALDSTIPGAVPEGYDAFRREWETQIGAAFPVSKFSPATTGDLRARTRVAKLRDVVVTDIHSVSSLRTATPPGGVEDQVLLYVVGGGAWTLGELPDRSDHTVSAGQFLLRHVGRPLHFRTARTPRRRSWSFPPRRSHRSSGTGASPGRRTRPRYACSRPTRT